MVELKVDLLVALWGTQMVAESVAPTVDLLVASLGTL